MVRFIKTHKKFSAVVFVMLVLIVLRANSYRIALHVSGLAETERIYTFAADRHSPWVGSHGNEVFRIIFSANNNGEFVMLRRNFFGIWRVQSRNSARCPSTGSLTYLWTTGIPGTHNLLINYVYHNPRISFSDNMRAHIRPYMWFQVCDAVSHGRTSARVIPCQNASYYIFHFSAEGGEAFNALAPIDYSVDLVVAQVANWVDMVKNPWHPVIDLKKYGECEPVEPLPERRAVTGSVLINNHPTLFHAYEINDELFFAISDVSAALQRTQARFWHQDFFISYDFDFHIFNERVYARLADILTLPFNKPQLTQIRDLRMSIDTNEPYVSEYHRQLAADFMVSAYPHLFTRESIPRYFEFYCGDGYCHPLLTYVIDFHLFDFGDGIPAIGVRYAPPGSGSNSLIYVYLGGEYREVGFMPLVRDTKGRLLRCQGWCEIDERWLYIHIDYTGEEVQAIPIDEEIVELLPSRSFVALTYDITDYVNQKLWTTRTLPNGVVVDTALCDEVIDVILRFFDEMSVRTQFLDCMVESVEWMQSIAVNEIKNSLILENLIRVKATRDHEFVNYYWLQMSVQNGSWAVDNYIVNWWWPEE